MDYGFFLKPLLLSFAVSASLLTLFLFLDKKFFFSDARISERHIHRKGISRFGGIALIISFVVAILLDGRLVMTTPLLGIMVASLAILIFGIIDDLKQLFWKKQLYFQIAIILLVYFLGIRLEYVTNPFGGILLFQNVFGLIASLIIVVGWSLLIINSMNWIDGVDGVSAGIAFIGGAAIFFLSLRPEVNQPPVGIIAAAFLGGLAAFLIFNFHPAKILAGTSGAMFMGFLLAAAAIFAGAKIATTLLVLIIPIVDALWVIGERFRSGSSIFSADKRHLHHRLLQIGWSQRQICIFYYGITAIIAVVALNTGVIGKLITFVLFGIVMLGALAFIRNKTAQKA